MPKGKYVRRAGSRRRYPRFLRRFRRHKQKMPLSVGVGLATSLLAPPATGWGSALNAVKAGKMDEALQSFVCAWTGLKIGGIGGQAEMEFDPMTALNPLDMSNATAWKSMLWTHIATRVIKAVVKKDPLQQVPIIKKFVSFA